MNYFLNSYSCVMKIKLVFIILCIIPFTLFSQENKRIDSLNNVLTRKIQDSVRIKTLLDLAITLQESDINLSSKTADKAYKLIQKINYDKALSLYYLTKSREYYFKSDFKKGLLFANLAHNNTLKEGDERKHLSSCQYKALVINANNMDFKASIKFLERKLDSINKKNKFIELAGVYFSLASSYSRDNKFNSAIKNFMTAITIYDANNDPIGIRNCYFEICDIYTLTGDYNSALLYSNKIFDLTKKYKLNSKRDKTLDLAKAGEIQLKLGNFKKAEALLLESFKLCNEIGDEFNRSYIVTNIIQNTLELKKYEKVITLCEQELKRSNLNTEFSIIFYNYLAIAHLKSNHLKLAKKTIEKALLIIEIKHGENISVYDNASNIYYQLKDYQKAYFFLNKYNKLYEKINSEYNAQKVETIQAEFKLIDKELEIKNLKLAEQAKDIKLAKQLKNIYLIVSLMFIFVVITVLIFIVYRNSVKNNKALKNKNIIIEEKNQLLQKVITEKDLLIKEIHHRVKNNLQLVMSILNIQASDKENSSIEGFIEKGQSRIASMVLIHENLYQKEDIGNIDFETYTKSLVNNIRTTFGEISERIVVHINMKDVFFDVQFSIPLGLIINELVTNSFKHGFPNEKTGQITISIELLSDSNYKLSIKDSGIGFPKHKVDKKSIGMELVSLLVLQLKGILTIESKNGTAFEIIFAIT